MQIMLPTSCQLAFDASRAANVLPTGFRRISCCATTCQLDSTSQQPRVLLRPLRSLAAKWCPHPPHWVCVGVQSAVCPPFPRVFHEVGPLRKLSGAFIMRGGRGVLGRLWSPPQPRSWFFSFLPSCPSVPGAWFHLPAPPGGLRRPGVVAPRPWGRLQCPQAGKRRPQRRGSPFGPRRRPCRRRPLSGLRRSRPAPRGHRGTAPGSAPVPGGLRPKGPGSDPGAQNRGRVPLPGRHRQQNCKEVQK